RSLGSGSIGESLLDSLSFLEESLLACGTTFPESGTHSKAPLFRNSEDVFPPTLFRKRAGFSSFFRGILPGALYITLGLGLIGGRERRHPSSPLPTLSLPPANNSAIGNRRHGGVPRFVLSLAHHSGARLRRLAIEARWSRRRSAAFGGRAYRPQSRGGQFP